MRDSHALATLGFRPTTLFECFPYLVTRVVPTMYHIIVLPDDLDAARIGPVVADELLGLGLRVGEDDVGLEVGEAVTVEGVALLGASVNASNS